MMEEKFFYYSRDGIISLYTKYNPTYGRCLFNSCQTNCIIYFIFYIRPYIRLLWYARGIFGSIHRTLTMRNLFRK